jgi:uncharacterized sulfatase
MKQSLFENSAKAPLIIASPSQKAKGQGSPRVVEFVDIYPTVADLAGLKPPEDLAGVSLRPLLDEPDAKWERPAYTQVMRGQWPGYSVRTERYRYTEWNGGKNGVELYDYEIDPAEEKNLADEPKYAETVAAMKKLLPPIAAKRSDSAKSL